MSLTSIGNPAWQSIRGVRFSMLNGPSFVTVLATHDAIDHIEPEIPGGCGRLACFNKHRLAFERAASAKHQRGELAESGAVIVEVDDIKSSRQ
jgi:hypothetical protein